MYLRQGLKCQEPRSRFRPRCGRAGSSCTMALSRSSIASGASGQECCIGWSDNDGQASVEQEPAEGPRAPAQRQTAGQRGEEGNCPDADRPRAIAPQTCGSEWRTRGIRLVPSPSAWSATSSSAGGTGARRRGPRRLPHGSDRMSSRSTSTSSRAAATSSDAKRLSPTVVSDFGRCRGR